MQNLGLRSGLPLGDDTVVDCKILDFNRFKG